MQNFNVDISAPGGPLVFYAMQADSLSRFFTLTITDSGEAWDPPDGALWSVRFGAPKMPSGWYDTIKDATDATHPAVNVATGVATVATVEIAEHALESPGQNILCVLVTDSSGYQIASWQIILSIQAVPGLTAPEVTTYYNLLTGQVAQTLQNAQAAAASATLAESWAVGRTGTREGEDTNNSEYWAQQSQDAANNRVASFNGRTGAVMPQSGDYTAEMVGALSTWGKALAAQTADSCTGNAATATKLAAARKIGSASFDGSQNITLEQMGALSNLQPDSFTTATPITGTDLSSVTVKYSKVGDFVFLFGVATIGTTENKTLNVASGLPIPSANYYGNKIAPITASSNFVANARVGGDGKLIVYLANAAWAGNNIYFSGFYFAD